MIKPHAARPETTAKTTNIVSPTGPGHAFRGREATLTRTSFPVIECLARCLPAITFAQRAPNKPYFQDSPKRSLHFRAIVLPEMEDRRARLAARLACILAVRATGTCVYRGICRSRRMTVDIGGHKLYLLVGPRVSCGHSNLGIGSCVPEFPVDIP